MDKNALKDFAMKSRESLTRMMRAKLDSLHIEENLTFKQHGNIWENEQHLLSAMTDAEYKRYEKLRSAAKRDGIKTVIEKAAYTWFNRIVAIRYMEVNDFLPLGKNFESLGINVLCDKSGDYRNPEIMTTSKLRSTDLKVDYDRLASLNDQDKYKEILLAIVKKLGEAIPDVFDGDTENIDALVPDGLLIPNGLIDNILKLGQEQFKHTEIIGWLYQYYNQAEKDRVMGDKSKKQMEKDDIPFVTQIFTPDWVVKYLVENSLGRYWLDRHPNTDLEKQWKYLVKKENASRAIKDSRKIEDITFIDPCSGSGHILIYAFEVFYQIYLSEGYPKCDIPQLILNNNLYGLDIDDRANQLSILACTLVARKYDDKLFTKTIKRHVLSIKESNKIDLSLISIRGEAEDILKYLINTFRDGKEYGSILKVRSMNYDILRNAIRDDQIAINFGLDKSIEPLIAQAEILSSSFTIAATNPPYMDKYDNKLKQYIRDYYFDEKSNMFSVFMTKCLDLLIDCGKVAMITPDAWMFLKSYTKFRKNLLEDYSITNMAHVGVGTFEGIGHVIIPTAFIISKEANIAGEYYKLLDVRPADKESSLLRCLNAKDAANTYKASSNDFLHFPDGIMAYWVSDAIKKVFLNSKNVNDFAKSIHGLVTGDNPRFLREWWEVNYNDVLFDCTSSAEAKISNKRWFPCNKGGQYRKWYGNNDYVINWKNDGQDIRDYGHATNYPPRPFESVVSWSQIASGDIAFRYKEAGSISDAGGPSLYGDEDDLSYLQGLLNSKVLLSISKFMSPSNNNNSGQIAIYPIVDSTTKRDEIISITNSCRQLSKDDWDDYEVSWNFSSHPLFKFRTDSGKLSDAFVSYEDYCFQRFSKLKANEESLNRIAIDLYGVNDEITPDVDENRITVRKADHEREAKSFLSYFIGCVMGRYDYLRSGIQFAGEGTELPNNNIVDNDGIITILDKEYLGRDDVINKLRAFLKESFGESTLLENLDWIADGLGRKDTERSEDVIRSYFVNEFFNNHAHMVYADPTKRSDGKPIYWEISSGKNNAFKALFYIHRYTPNLIAKVRMDYSTPILQTYDKRRSEIEAQLKTTVAPSEYGRLNNELADLRSKIEELTEFDRILKNVADQKIELDLNDGVKVNYPKLSLAASGVKKDAQILEAIK